MQTERAALKLLMVFAMTAAVVLPAAAQVVSYPNKPVTIVVGFSAGGSSDALARIVAEKLAIGLGQPVLVENRPGVASIVGAAFVAKAKPDGYTLLMGASGPNVFNYALYAKLPYAQQEFAPVSLLGTFPLLLLANASNPAKNVQELIAQSRQNPDKSNYGASSASFQLVTELFNAKTGARFSHIPYKGSNDAITALISGDVTMTLVDAGAASAVLQGGRVKALAVTSAERLKDMPGVPTLSELGVDLKVSFWSGLLAPAGTPAPVIKRLQDEIAKVMNMPDVRSRFTAMSVVPASSTPEEFAKVIATEIPLWKQLALDNNIKAN
ncbi:MAG: tripartite tricarboxylate transporter substrate binding protein [Pseudomonadota bacterium]